MQKQRCRAFLLQDSRCRVGEEAGNELAQPASGHRSECKKIMEILSVGEGCEDCPGIGRRHFIQCPQIQNFVTDRDSGARWSAAGQEYAERKILRRKIRMTV